MKKTLRLVGVAAMVLLLAASCKKEEKNNGEKQMMTFSAGIEQTGAKTGLLPNGSHAFKQVWTAGDAINVNGTSLTVSINPEDNAKGTFTGEVLATGKYYAVYPATAALSNSTATFVLPESQKYVVDSYDSNLAPMAAYTENNELNFTNLCGLMELSLVGDGITVTGLELSCNKPICGRTKEYTIGGDAALEMTEGADKTVTMNCGEGVALNGTTPTSFIFVLPPVTKGNFSLKVTYVAGANTIQKTIALPADISITASQVVYNTTSYELVGVNGTVTTDDVTNVTSSGASVAYTVTPNGVSQARQHGVCYDTIENPTISGTHTVAMGTTYTASLTSLYANTTYYVRAYAIFEPAAKNEGDVVVYGDEKSFTTEQETPTDASATIEEVRKGTNGFWVRGVISGTSGDAEVGVCYSKTNSTPTYEDGHSTINTSATSFSVDVPKTKTDGILEINTQYYYRTYIKYNGGVAYGTVQTLTTEPDYHSSGPGTVSDTYYFSVSKTKKVVFSKGNLQYNAGLDEWRFAEHQYDVVSDQYNTAPHANYPVWTDLFAYGTSGFDDAPSHQPWYCGTTDILAESLTGNKDWGYNKIVNGGNTNGQWHTMTREEMGHLIGCYAYELGWTFGFREKAEEKRGCATVNGRPGLVILPDNWPGLPDGCSFTPTDDNGAFTANQYSVSQWASMEARGAVFLPVSTMRIGESRFYDWDNVNPDDRCFGQEYWLNGVPESGRAYRFMLHNRDFGLPGSSYSYYCMPLRLVKTYE